jgi:hypothetical protein
VITLLRELRDRGIRLRLKGDEIEFTAPQGAMTTELRRELRACRSELRDYLVFQSLYLARDPASGGDAVPELSLDPAELLADAARAEGSDDLGPEAASLREALAVYAESVERDARPHAVGRLYLRERFFRIALVTRIRLAPHLARGARPRRAPLVVCGLPRSGTTLLHRLLALADEAAGIPLWQLIEPLAPSRGPDQRRENATRNLAWLRALAPASLDAQHYLRPDLPDECGHLLRTAFLGPMPWQVPAYGWLEWAMRADARPAYRVWAALLSGLEPEGRRLVLKDPFHAAWLEEVLAVCPDALVVQTHRDPVEIVPSFHKLATTMHSVLVPRLDLPRTVRAHMKWLTWHVERNAAARAALRPRHLLDVHYRELVEDPIGTVVRVHEAFALPVSDAHVARMRAHLAETGQRRHGENPYAPEDYGQTADEIAGCFAEYRRRFDLAPRRATR